MKHLLTTLFLTFFLFSCTESVPPNPLEATRQKLAEAESISFVMNSIWNNTFIGDTMVDSAHKGIFQQHYSGVVRE